MVEDKEVMAKLHIGEETSSQLVEKPDKSLEKTEETNHLLVTIIDLTKDQTLIDPIHADQTPDPLTIRAHPDAPDPGIERTKSG